MERSAGSPLEIAARLRHAVRERGRAARHGRGRPDEVPREGRERAAKPDGLLLVPPDREAAFLHPLPVEAMWGVGAKTAVKLRDRGMRRSATRAHARAGARGDARAGRPAGTSTRSRTSTTRARRLRPRRRSIGSQHAWGHGRDRPAEVDADLVALVERVMRRVRAAKRVGRTVVLRLRFDDFSRATRSHTLPHPTARTRVVLEAARELLAAA